MNLKYLKKCIFLLFTIMLILMTLSSCSLLQDAFSDPLENVFESHVQRIKYWQFQHNSETNDYSVFFAFEDENGKEIAESGTAKIRLEDEEGNVLYSKSVSFGKSNFGYFSNQTLGEHYYAQIRIKETEISLAKSESGTMYLTVFKSGSYQFDEVYTTVYFASENVRESQVQTLRYWQIQHNSGTNDYSVFFAFEDENGKEIAASGTAQLRIEDEESNILYEGTKMFSKSDFDYYSNEKLGSHYYVCIRINDSEVVKGVSESGKLFLTISGDQYRFDEVNCTALYCLPVKDVTLNAEKLPKEIVNKNYSGAVTSKITITDIQYVFGKDSLMSLKITIIGEKNYGENGSLYDDFKYKIYDHEGFMVDNGTVFLSSLAKGDKFKKEITFYDAKPGETYTIKFENG